MILTPISSLLFSSRYKQFTQYPEVYGIQEVPGQLVLGVAGSGWGDTSPGSPVSPAPITTSPTPRPASDLILFPVCSSPAGSRRSDFCGLNHLVGEKDTELPLSTPVSTRVLVRDKGEKASPLSVWEGFLEEEALYRGEQDMSLQVHWGRVCKRGCKP